jgi:hypothetical protein
MVLKQSVADRGYFRDRGAALKSIFREKWTTALIPEIGPEFREYDSSERQVVFA